MLKLTILSPERRLLEGTSVEEATLRGAEGQVQILPGHAPMVGVFELGAFSYREKGDVVNTGVISSGFFEVRDDQLTVVAETLELEQEIDVERARKAQQQAEAALKSAELDEHRFRKYQLKLERALIRQQVASKQHQ